MNKREKINKKVNSYLYDHIWLKRVLDYGVAFFASVISAAIFSFGIVCFLKPGGGLNDLASGGSSGLAQALALLLEIFGIKYEANSTLIFTIIYFGINIPLLVLAFKGIGIRFATFTLVNVVTVTILTNVFNSVDIAFFDEFAEFVSNNGGMLTRALFAGLCTGLSSAIAYKIEASAGGFDIVSYYISLRKNTSVGQYIGITNGIILVTFYTMTGIYGSLNHVDKAWPTALASLLFSVVYLVETITIVDIINTRNKKVQLQIITENKDLPRALIANIPHGATIVKGTGAYSGNERIIVYLVISSGELKKAIKFIKEIDPNSFVNVTTLQQVYGRFYMKPVK